MLSEAEVKRFIEREKNENWIISHYNELKKQYADRWVAVKDQKVVGAGTSYRNLIANGKKEYGEQFCEIAVEYIATKESPVILSR